MESRASGSCVVQFTSEAEEDFARLDGSQRKEVAVQLRKIERSPQLGAPLGNRAGLDLSGYRKLYACRKSIRIVYRFPMPENDPEADIPVALIVAIGPRGNLEAYRLAADRHNR
ncbi:MAG: addiction module toxin RelE [Nitrospirota bacterium]